MSLDCFLLSVSLSVLTEASLSCLLHLLTPPPLHLAEPATVTVFVAVSVPLSLGTTSQMWSRDSGQFVMNQCKIRQPAQLSEPEGAESAAEQS